MIITTPSSTPKIDAKVSKLSHRSGNLFTWANDGVAIDCACCCPCNQCTKAFPLTLIDWPEQMARFAQGRPLWCLLVRKVAKCLSGAEQSSVGIRLSTLACERTDLLNPRQLTFPTLPPHTHRNLSSHSIWLSIGQWSMQRVNALFPYQKKRSSWPSKSVR